MTWSGVLPKEGPAVLDELLTAARDGLATIGSAIGDTINSIDADPVPGDPTTPGRKPDGPRPQAAEIRAATLPVPGDVDHARARDNAERVLRSIDFSRPEIVLWVPATESHSIPASWKQAVEQQFPPGRASLALLDYPASFNFNDSVSTGMETMRLVLAGIAERGGHHRVTLAGHSQGAWVIGDSLDTPEIGRMVDRAIMYGHPAPARVDWSRGTDPDVRQVDDPNDPFTTPLEGGRQALRAIDELEQGRRADGQGLGFGDYLQRIGTLAGTALSNPRLSAYLIGKHVLPQDGPAARDPHHYDEQYAEGAKFLAG